jgi:hypothetical protein
MGYECRKDVFADANGLIKLTIFLRFFLLRDCLLNKEYLKNYFHSIELFQSDPAGYRARYWIVLSFAIIL